MAISENPVLDETGVAAITEQLKMGNVARVAEWIRQQARGPQPAVFYLGRQPYCPTWDLQKQLHAWRVAGKLPDVALLLEHEPVYTLGKNANEAHLLIRRPLEAAVVAIDRGGDVTYHGPGQLVGYPIVNLQDHRPSVTWYMRGLEEVIIQTLATYGINAGRMEGLPGVWVRRRKVAALGVRLARWTTMHGFALNVSVPQRYLDGMIPCGLLEYGVTNLNAILPAPTDVWEVARRITPILQDFLGRSNARVSGIPQDQAA
ncbi:MAG: lipoyl(octanoyl) transferase LipB [Candidatus Neomarinimicrobiota bacterium]